MKMQTVNLWMITSDAIFNFGNKWSLDLSAGGQHLVMASSLYFNAKTNVTVQEVKPKY